MPKTPTTHALLGLLAVRPWTAYELTQQMQRALKWAWPRSEANLYTEVKGLVPEGLALAVEEEVGGRSRTRYEITDQGRAAVSEWLGDGPPAPIQVQFEALLRVFLADQGAPSDLAQTIAATREQVLATAEQAIPLLEEYASEQPPFPDRAHLNVLFMHFFAGLFELVLTWCDDVEAEMETWPDTTSGVGMTPGTKRMLDEALEFYRTSLKCGQRGG